MFRRSALMLGALTVPALAAMLAAGVLAAPLLPPAKIPLDVCPGPGQCPYSTIQSAIGAALEGDTIRVAGSPGSPYNERLVITKTITIQGGYSGPGPQPWQRNIALYTTIVNGQSLGTAVTFNAGSATLEGFTVTGGSAGVDGGGILINNASPVISATTIISNTAGSSGGGVAIHGGAAHLISDTISNNTGMGGAGLLVADGATTEVRGTTIANNQAAFAGGGVLLVNGAAPTIAGSVIRGNRAPSGGGLQAQGAQGLVQVSQISENDAQSGSGGGVNLFNSGLTLESVLVMSNTASLDGGGIAMDSASPVIHNSTIRANRARAGAGVQALNSLGQLTSNTVISNTATAGSGGGLLLDRSAPLLDANTVISNTASTNGGGIEISGRYCANDLCDDPLSVNVINGVIARNSATGRGAGIHVDSGSGPEIINNTVVSNRGEGIVIDAYAEASISNTILVNNTTGILAMNPSAWHTDYNLVWSNFPGGNYSGLAPGAHDLTGDPRFVAPANMNYLLRSDSPAIDSGRNAVAPGSDHDGNVRPLPGRCGDSAIADIGAYEFLLDPGACQSATPTPSTTPTATSTATVSPTGTATGSLTATATATGSRTQTSTPTSTGSLTPSRTATATASRTSTAAASASPSATPSRTATAALGTATATGSATRTATATATATATPAVEMFTLHLPVVLANFAAECLAYEPNNDITQTWGPLLPGVSYHAYLCAFDAVDWYFVDTPGGGTLSVDLAVPNRQDLNLFLYAEDGSFIASSEGMGEGGHEEISTSLESPGRWLLRVVPFSRRDPTQRYDLSYRFF